MIERVFIWIWQKLFVPIQCLFGHDFINLDYGCSECVRCGYREYHLGAIMQSIYRSQQGSAPPSTKEEL
jgi:hypothetical protein